MSGRLAVEQLQASDYCVVAGRQQAVVACASGQGRVRAGWCALPAHAQRWKSMVLGLAGTQAHSFPLVCPPALGAIGTAGPLQQYGRY